MADVTVCLHSQFDLKPQCSEAGFKVAYDAFAGHLRDAGFVVSWQLSRRLAHAGYDTNPPLTAFVAELLFADRAAMYAAWDHVEADGPEVAVVHRAVNQQVCNAVFFLSEAVG